MARGVRFSERVVQFYSGQLVLALEYLHHVGVLYRDLRPDNVLVDTRGYIRLRSRARYNQPGSLAHWRSLISLQIIAELLQAGA